MIINMEYFQSITTTFKPAEEFFVQREVGYFIDPSDKDYGDYLSKMQERLDEMDYRDGLSKETRKAINYGEVVSLEYTTVEPIDYNGILQKTRRELLNSDESDDPKAVLSEYRKIISQPQIRDLFYIRTQRSREFFDANIDSKIQKTRQEYYHSYLQQFSGTTSFLLAGLGSVIILTTLLAPNKSEFLRVLPMSIQVTLIIFALAISSGKLAALENKKYEQLIKDEAERIENTQNRSKRLLGVLEDSGVDLSRIETLKIKLEPSGKVIEI